MEKKIRLAIAGMGNCAWSLVQGLEFYKNINDTAKIPGLMHANLGGYRIKDIELVAAFDVDANKVGKDAKEALESFPNNTIEITKVKKTGVTVMKGPALDGIGKYYKTVIKESTRKTVNVAAVLKATKADVLVSYMPVGSEKAVQYYATEALKAGVAFVNAIPVFIASRPEWSEKFRDAGVPLIGDDIKSQVGATIVHRVLTKLFGDRGCPIYRTYQLNFGGNMDFMNMLERERLHSKKISKTGSVMSQMQNPIDQDENVHVGPSDYIPWLKDRKWCYIRMEGSNFGEIPLNLECKLEVWDSPNSAGVIIDAVRCAKIAKDRKIGGLLEGPCAYFMKTPPKQFSDTIAREMVEDFIKGY
ncbi:MAG: inositol-3-phosphate synthase [Spirochaetia bacterium]|nr:inositol-3-phosphate synthase [Spirochaetia bacterium]